LRGTLNNQWRIGRGIAPGALMQYRYSNHRAWRLSYNKLLIIGGSIAWRRLVSVSWHVAYRAASA